MVDDRLQLDIPGWLEAMAPRDACMPDAEARMRLAVALADANVAHGGGPFGAVVVERTSGRLVASGVNLVEPANLSIAHAEVVALSLAQQRLGSYDLGGRPEWDYELVTSAEPCIQCFGAAIWAGVRSVVCGARSADAEAVGFDEGPKPADWVAHLEARGIAVHRDVLRNEAAQVIRDYVARGGAVYNARGS
ncbi:nucleoside deaminase [Thiohalorhabdus sp. Cl-TMA]|uniref:Nucleoside deaminase n=1 Tax=Thiohalorhabdus methylotrophus TaxID=3242694 RepID=A0ABV4TTP9_9GAMM